MTNQLVAVFTAIFIMGCDSDSSSDTNGSMSGMGGGTSTLASNVGGSSVGASNTGGTTSGGGTTAQAEQPITATIESRSGSSATGTVVLSSVSEGVKVRITVAGAPQGAHGIHFHATGDCSATDATSAKDHYNPTQQPHALPDTTPRHLGDMGNIEVGADGTGTLEITLPDVNLTPSAPNTLRGTAIILHEKADDGGQPTGNAGARIGCGVIPS